MTRGLIEPHILFPVVIQSRDGTTTFYTAEEPLVRITKKALVTKALEGATIIDSSGMKYKVARVVNLGFTNLLWGLNVFLESEVHVRVELDSVEELSLDKFKSFAKKIARSNEDYYLSGGTDLQTILSAIERASDVSALTRILSGEMQNSFKASPRRV
jgi:hypothetical protein